MFLFYWQAACHIHRTLHLLLASFHARSPASLLPSTARPAACTRCHISVMHTALQSQVADAFTCPPRSMNALLTLIYILNVYRVTCIAEFADSSTLCCPRSMYALLMLLPQGKAFDVLNRRLGAVPLHALMHLDEPAVPPAGTIPIPMSSGGASASHASRSKDAEAAAPGGSGRAAEAGAAPHQQEDSGEGSVSGPPPVAAPEPATAEGRGQWAPFGDLLRQFVAKQRQQLEREDEGALEAGKPPASAAAPAVAGGSSGGG